MRAIFTFPDRMQKDYFLCDRIKGRESRLIWMYDWFVRSAAITHLRVILFRLSSSFSLDTGVEGWTKFTVAFSANYLRGHSRVGPDSLSCTVNAGFTLPFSPLLISGALPGTRIILDCQRLQGMIINDPQASCASRWSLKWNIRTRPVCIATSLSIPIRYSA